MEQEKEGEARARVRQVRGAIDTVGHGPLAGVESTVSDPVEEDVTPNDEHLLALVDRHIMAEAADLEGYQELARSPDPVMSELMGLIVEDEERHHRLLRRLAVRLQDDLNWERSQGALPPEQSPLDADGRRALERVREFVRHEHRGAQHLHALAQEARELRRPLAALLLETMVLDSQKHEIVLWHLARRLQRAR